MRPGFPRAGAFVVAATQRAMAKRWMLTGQESVHRVDGDGAIEKEEEEDPRESEEKTERESGVWWGGFVF